MTNNITRKRRFIIDFGYPNGQEMCAELGLVPADADVAALEQDISLQRNSALYNSPIEAHVHHMAGWATEVIASGTSEPVPESQLLQLRILFIEFHRASLASLLDDGLISIEGVEVRDA